MGIYLGQLPPAEVARLKAELAETLIASFCYPRFFDYRTGALRMRPVDRSKRQEVWLYLSSVDFTAWNRIDLMTPEFQYQIERLFIQFVQRNRSFFGNQGRKRMSDIRMLIGTASATVAEDLRNHLTGQRKNRPPFGSPRPVPSWATTNAAGLREPNWEQIAPSAVMLQQQLQEARGEIRPVPQLPTPARDEARQATPMPSPTPKRPVRGQTVGKAVNGSQQDGSAVAIQTVNGSAPQVVQGTTRNGSSGVSTSATRASGPLRPPVSPVPPVSGTRIEAPGVPTPPAKPPSQAAVNSQSQYGRTETPTMPQLPQVSAHEPVKTVAPTPTPASAAVAQKPVLAQGVSQAVASSAASGTANQQENKTAVLNGEDVAIFEQLRHQMLVWLRVEAIHCELDISDQSPTQLLDRLHQQEGIDETRLQVVSSLLNLANQVIKKGQASPQDYKQAMMFHLMHSGSR